MKNSRNGTEGISSFHPPSVFLIRREKERHLARLHTPRSRGFVTGRASLTPGRTRRGQVSVRVDMEAEAAEEEEREEEQKAGGIIFF